MKIGVFYDMRNPPQAAWHMPWNSYYSAAFEHMEEVEQLGFDSISFGEHHGDPDGYNPGLPALLGAVAQRTRKVRIGTNIVQAPLYHPVLLAEQLAVIDVMSDGRLDVGLGQVGPAFDMEFEMMGTNPKYRPSLLDEAIDVIQQCWVSDEPFDYHGKRFDLRGVWLNPKPLQQPLPVWVVASAFTKSDKAMDRVASRGLGVGSATGHFLGLTGGETWTHWLDRWKAACVRHGRAPDYADIYSFGTCFVTDDPEREWAKHRKGIFYNFHYQRQGVHPYSSMMMETPPQKPEDIPNWQAIFRTPEQVIEEVRTVYADRAPTELSIMAKRTGMTFEESAVFLRNFIEKVAPAIRDL